MQLFVVRGDEEVPALALGPLPVYVGRGPDNDLVVHDATVSTRHAVFWLEGGRAWVRDCGSLNGTFVRDARVRGPAELPAGEPVRLGTGTALVARGNVPREGEDRPQRGWALEDVEAGVQYPIRDGRIRLGPCDAADLCLDVDDDHETVIAVHPGGEIMRSTVDTDEPLDVGELFEVGGRRFRVVESDGSLVPTRDGAPDRDVEYRLSVTLDGVTGAEAVVEDPATGRRHVIEAENRAVLLYVLARRAADARGASEVDASWCSDDDVSTAVWGRRGGADGNSLHVLVHRLRKELKEAGFDPWFLEKRRKAIRVALRDVQVR